MPDGLHGPNAITAGESVLLLVAVSGGEAVHLVRRQKPTDQAVVPTIVESLLSALPVCRCGRSTSPGLVGPAWPRGATEE
ncbi:hypothetical protein FXF52_40030 [Micromonospora sp. MP36]|nr:hypothetical protein FXF52_40030 [Micromonospora sp. MP36]